MTFLSKWAPVYAGLKAKRQGVHRITLFAACALRPRLQRGEVRKGQFAAIPETRHLTAVTLVVKLKMGHACSSQLS